MFFYSHPHEQHDDRKGKIMKKLALSVLVVEDDGVILEQLSILLGRRVEKLYTATNGQEGLALYRTHFPDVIISDVDMPIMNGIEFLKNVRAEDEYIPFILSTGLKNLEVLCQAIEYKITAFLPKPIDVKILISKLQEIAKRKQLLNDNHILEQYKQVVDSAALVSKTNPKGIITYVNDIFVNLSGYTREELVGQPHNIVRDPSISSDIFKEMWQTIQNKEIWQGILHNRTKDGRRYSVKSTISPILNEEGEIIEFIAIREDITNLIERDEQLQKERQKLDDILNNINSIVGMASPDEKMLFLNSQFFDIFPFENFDAFRSKHECVCELFESREGYVQPLMGGQHWLEYVIENPEKIHEVIMIDKHNEERIYGLDIQNIASDSDHSYVITLSDITEIKHSKAEAVNAAKMKGEFLANMSHEIRTPMNGILGFTALLTNTDLSEKQRRYLNIITGSTETLMGIVNDILDFSKLESGKFELDITNINPFIEFEKTALLFEAKMGEKEIVFDRLIDPLIPECIQGDLLRLRQVISNLIGNALKFTPNQGNVTFYIQLLENRGNRVDLRFGVIDTGIGIAKEKQEVIFEAFSQADGSITRHFGGTGLGLSISSHLVSLMEGILRVKSDLGHGSEFYFDITLDVCKPEHTLASYFDTLKIVIVNEMSRRPCQERILDYLQQMRIPFKTVESDSVNEIDSDTLYILFCEGSMQWLSRIKAANAPLIIACSEASFPVIEGDNMIWIRDLNHNLSALYNALLEMSSIITKNSCLLEYSDRKLRGKLLVADDNLVNQTLIEEILGKFALKPTIVNNGAEALERVKTTTYDLILMDINMPIMGGIEAVQAIKAHGVTTPVVALTANAMGGDRERLMAYGFDGYLTKPIVHKELEHVLKQYLTEIVTTSQPKDTKRGSKRKEFGKMVDIEFLRKELLLSDTIIHRLLGLFSKTCDAPLEKMKNALEEDDKKGLVDAAHLLRGSAANLRLTHIAKLAHTIEESDEKCTKEEYISRIAVLETMVAQVKNEIEEIIAV